MLHTFMLQTQISHEAKAILSMDSMELSQPPPHTHTYTHSYRCIYVTDPDPPPTHTHTYTHSYRCIYVTDADQSRGEGDPLDGSQGADGGAVTRGARVAESGRRGVRRVPHQTAEVTGQTGVVRAVSITHTHTHAHRPTHTHTSNCISRWSDWGGTSSKYHARAQTRTQTQAHAHIKLQKSLVRLGWYEQYHARSHIRTQAHAHIKLQKSLVRLGWYEQ